jgi:hypothetical protein
MLLELTVIYVFELAWFRVLHPCGGFCFLISNSYVFDETGSQVDSPRGLVSEALFPQCMSWSL